MVLMQSNTINNKCFIFVVQYFHKISIYWVLSKRRSSLLVYAAYLTKYHNSPGKTSLIFSATNVRLL